ncbi:MAG: DUF3341 domain-containing protein [Holophagales bacterium]|nr:DUF3341 domain-containing protein [Holophagales bacterium]
MTAAAQDHLVEAAFESVEDVRSAVEAALDSGVAASQIEVRSPAPLEEGELPLAKPKSRVLLFALSGAVLGGLTAFGLAAGTALAYPLPTGGMSIVAGPPVGVVTYEGTALGLIIMTVLRVLWEGGLLPGRAIRSGRGRPSDFDRHVAEGRLVLRIHGLTESGAEELRELCRPRTVALG